MEPVPEVIGRGVAGGVEGADVVEAFTDDVVVADDDAGDGGEEDGVGGEIGCEVVGGAEEVPEGWSAECMKRRIDVKCGFRMGG